MEELINSYKEKIPGGILDALEKELADRKLTKKDVEKVLLRLVQIYERTKINAGEAIGVITAESFGEPSTQMCASYDEKVIFKLKNRIRIMKIGEFVDKVFERVKTRKFRDYEVYNNTDDLFVLSLDKDEKLKWRKISALNRVKSPEKLIKIITKTGRKITATDYHSFITRKNNKIISVAGKDLRLGDRLPVISYLPEHCVSAISVCEYIPGSIENDGRLSGKTIRSKSIPNLIKLDELFGFFIGAYLAEGNAHIGQIGISNINERYISNLKDFLDRIGMDYVDRIYRGEYGPSRTLLISSSILSKFIISICGSVSKNKSVPEFAYSANQEFVKGLLKGYFDGDGNFTIDRKMIRVSSNSEELLDGIKLLLTRFKIFAYKSKDHKQHYLIIPYKYAPQYLKKIGSIIESKRNSLMKLSSLAKKNILKGYKDHNDMISGFDNLLVKISRRLKLPTRYVNSATKRQRIGRTALFRHIKRFENKAKERRIDIKSELDILKKMFNSDVVWDEIIKKEYVKALHKFVYDLSVPGLETFTTFDGVVTHNTLNVFHFAGVAEMSVSLGLPRLIEIFDARKTIKTPMMSVFIKPQWNKDPLKVKKIAASVKEIKLKEVALNFIINIPKLQVEVNLSKKKMRNLSLNEEDILKAISEGFSKLNVKLGTDKLILKPKSEVNQLMELYKIKEKTKVAYISGVKGVKQVLPVKSGNEFMILTSGSNLKDVFKIKEVDETRTFTNDIHEVKKVLGIEAARQAVINESSKVMNEQGLDVDIRHIMFVADVITSSGFIKGITRSGITGEKESVLARASFETPIKHIVNASLVGEEDNLNSVIENVILNQPVPLGTGLPDLVIKMKEVEK